MKNFKLLSALLALVCATQIAVGSATQTQEQLQEKTQTAQQVWFQLSQEYIHKGCHFLDNAKDQTCIDMAEKLEMFNTLMALKPRISAIEEHVKRNEAKADTPFYRWFGAPTPQEQADSDNKEAVELRMRAAEEATDKATAKTDELFRNCSSKYCS